MKAEMKRTNFMETIVSLFLVAALAVGCQGNKSGDSSDDTPKDTVPPTITAYSQCINLGESIDLMDGVEAVKDGKKVPVTVDDSKLDLKKAGDYTVTYTAGDSDCVKAVKSVKVRVVDPNKKVIYLTFDDGPSKLTPDILKILKDNGVHATFFVTGSHQEYHKYMKQAYEEGNVIAAHCFEHEYHIYTSFDTYFKDLDKIEALIKKQTGHTTPVIRFPGGSSNHAFARFNSDPYFMVNLCKEVQRRGYQYVDWNHSNKDASANMLPVSTLIAEACRPRHGEQYILMHDSPAKKTTVEALPTIIQYFKDQGYEFGLITGTEFVCHHDIAPYSHNGAIMREARMKFRAEKDSIKAAKAQAAAAKAQKPAAPQAQKAAAPKQ